MDLLWPGFLLLLVAVPLIVAAYVWAQRRRRVALRYSSLALLREALPRYSWLRRHLPFALFLCALASLIVALGRPVRIMSVPTSHATIMLAMDVSGSMRQSDIPPSRLEAAQAAALSFIHSQKTSTQIGIVAFASYAELIQPPTTDQEALESAIESLTVGFGTAIGDGILKSIDAISTLDHSVAPSVSDPSSGARPLPVPKGAYAPDIIVLLTDGVNNAGPLPLDAARQAADRGVRVYTIGFGTAQGSSRFGGGGFFGGGNGGNGGNGGGNGGGFFGGNGGNGGGNQQFGGGRQFGGFRRGIDEATLKQIAHMTGGTYYAASSAQELLKVFQRLPTYLIIKHEVVELSVIFAALGALLVVVSSSLALRWHPLP